MMEFKCAVCLEMLEQPCRSVTCLHAFCAKCIVELVASKSGCPLCRTPITTLSIAQDIDDAMRQADMTCEGCSNTLKADQLRAHQATCQDFKDLEATRASTVKPAKTMQVVNRSTFQCPFPNCGASNLEHKGLIQHLQYAHAGSTCAAVCPICKSMPWGDPNYVSRDVVAHIQLRHKFEYTEYVDYQDSEDAVLQAVLAQSIQNQ